MNILDFLVPGSVALNYEANDSKDVIAHLGKCLFDAGYVRETFVDAALDRESRLPTGLPLSGDVNAACAGYLLIHQSFEKSKQGLHRPTHLYPSINMSLKDHFQKNTPLTDRQIQLALISRSSIDTIYPCSSGSDAERSVSIQISCPGIAVM